MRKLPSHFAARVPALRFCLTILLGACGVLCAPAAAHAQQNGDLSFLYAQERSRFVTGAGEEYFYLRGATIDGAYSIYHGLGVSGSGTGLAGTNLHGDIDIHQISFLVGPRYTYNLGHITPTAWNRKGSFFAEGKVGYTFATSGRYPVNGVITDHASALTYQAGAGVNLHIYHRLDARVIEADIVRTQLPNGSTNEQNTLRLAAGINFHFGY